MIIVLNTKELEEKYNLEQIRDDEQIIVLGGLEGKQKYNKERYRERVTYDARSLKLIIQQMKKIESKIPNEWDEYQKAKFIYVVLAENIDYENDKEKYKTENCSNLMGLRTGKAICAGYSLIFKEMMDRQGIKCDYIRGVVEQSGRNFKHAWNVLTIQGKTFPVDLTWDSQRVRRGKQDLVFFGNEPYFFEEHNTDKDEKKYKYALLGEMFVKAIDISGKIQNRKEIYEAEIKQNDRGTKKESFDYAIEKTYLKLLRTYDEKQARKMMIDKLKKYINDGSEDVFTREDGARMAIVENVTREDAMDVFVEKYVERSIKKDERNMIEKAVVETVRKYSKLSGCEALEMYIKEGKTTGFTRDNNARHNMMYNLDHDVVLNDIVGQYVHESIIQIKESNKRQQRYFKADEFAGLPITENKKENIIKSALSWLKEKTREFFYNKKGERNKKLEKEKSNKRGDKYNEI